MCSMFFCVFACVFSMSAILHMFLFCLCELVYLLEAVFVFLLTVWVDFVLEGGRTLGWLERLWDKDETQKIFFILCVCLFVYVNGSVFFYVLVCVWEGTPWLGWLERLWDKDETQKIFFILCVYLFSCPGQLNRWPCHSVSQWVSLVTRVNNDRTRVR